MNCTHKKQTGKAEVSQYASSEDFCHIFAEKMNNLYCLAFLLTADHEKAEQCFVAGLEDSIQSYRVFHSWAHRWAKRTIIENAIHTLKPHRLASSARAAIESNTLHAEADSEFGRVLALEDFARFVFVMSVLERHSDYECSTLLDASAHDIREARTRAFQEIADSLADAQTASFVRLRQADRLVAVHKR